MEFLGWSLLIVVAVICWPIIGAITYRFDIWLNNDSYKRDDADCSILFGPVSFLTVLFDAISFYLKRFNFIGGYMSGGYEKLLCLAGAPQKKKG